MLITAEVGQSDSFFFYFFWLREEVVCLASSSPVVASSIASTVRWMVGVLTLGPYRFFLGGGCRLSSFSWKFSRCVMFRSGVWWLGFAEMSIQSIDDLRSSSVCVEETEALYF